MADIDYYVSLGIDSFDFSGGEPSVHPHFIEAIKYASKFGTVSCLSNGYKFSQMVYLEKCHRSGLSEVMFSLHGVNHEDLTGVKNSKARILDAIRNCHILGIRVRLNCTVCKENYKDLMEYVAEVIKLEPFEVNFIIENPWYKDNRLNDRYFDIHEAGAILDDCCLTLEKNGIIPNVRYIPFCAMKNKKYILNYYQHLYDPYDWNLLYEIQEEVTSKTLFRKCVESIRSDRDNLYSKKGCDKCMYNHICDGIKDLSIPKPQVGKPILDVLEFRHGYFENFHKSQK